MVRRSQRKRKKPKRFNSQEFDINDTGRSIKQKEDVVSRTQTIYGKLADKNLPFKKRHLLIPNISNVKQTEKAEDRDGVQRTNGGDGQVIGDRNSVEKTVSVDRDNLQNVEDRDEGRKAEDTNDRQTSKDGNNVQKSEDRDDGHMFEDRDDGQNNKDKINEQKKQDKGDIQTNEDRNDEQKFRDRDAFGDRDDGRTNEDNDDEQTNEDRDDEQTNEDRGDEQTNEDRDDEQTKEDSDVGLTNEDSDDGRASGDSSDGQTFGDRDDVEKTDYEDQHNEEKTEGEDRINESKDEKRGENKDVVMDEDRKQVSFFQAPKICCAETLRFYLSSVEMWREIQVLISVPVIRAHVREKILLQKNDIAGIVGRLDILLHDSREMNAKLDRLQSRMDNIEDEMNELRESTDHNRVRISELESKQKSYDEFKEVIAGLKRENEQIQRDKDKLENQSRRNNLLFYGLEQGNAHETWEEAEEKVKDVLKNELEISEDIQFERCHRLNYAPLTRGAKPIIAMLTKFKDKVLILSKAKSLVLLGGDFNARTGSLSDFIVDDSIRHVPIIF
ncbi:uncharacterized protein DDB_G0283697-like [Ptychodera flava]|uniref:uncharacterized protein DDB_G0283697-like n=1 Tax=Ptychodera flava TaxID=63121 RepID=UPI003969E8FE